MTLGLCEDYPEGSRSIETARRDLQLLEHAGISVLRISIGWDEIEPEKGKFDFAFWDAFVTMAVKDFHVRLIPYVAYTPRWAVRKELRNNEDHWRHAPQNVHDWAVMLGTLARRYEGLIDSWELWNEPDNADYWRGTKEEFAGLLKVGAEAIRRVNPKLQVVLGGVAWDVEFLESMFRDHGVAPSIDVVNLHAYFETWHHAGLETLSEYVGRAREIVGRYGEGEAIWLAEVGYSNHRKGREVSSAYRARFDYEHSLDFAAVSLVRILARARATENVNLLAWYEVKDPPLGDDVIGDVNNRHLGVAFADHAPKPALAALRFMRSFLGVPLRVRDPDALISAAVGTDAVVHVFETADGALRVVAWLRTTSPRLVGIRSGVDPRAEEVTLTLPEAAGKRATMFNHLGRVIARRPLGGQGPDGTLSLTLRPGEVTVAEVLVSSP